MDYLSLLGSAGGGGGNSSSLSAAMDTSWGFTNNSGITLGGSGGATSKATGNAGEDSGLPGTPINNLPIIIIGGIAAVMAVAFILKS